MKNANNLPSVDKSLCNLLELLFAPEFYNAFNPKNFPPYNVVRVQPENCAGNSSDVYRIDIAVAGYSRDRLSVDVSGNNLYVTAVGDLYENFDEVVHRGISNRPFELRFKLNRNVCVSPDCVTLSDGILSIVLMAKSEEDSRVNINIK